MPIEDASAKAHHERMERGVAAVRDYLQDQFPGHAVEALSPGSRDISHRTRTFGVRKDREQYLLRVADEVLDQDAGAWAVLQQFGVAFALRQTGSGKALLITTHGIRAEPAT
jgi:hypothetical protein